MAAVQSHTMSSQLNVYDPDYCLLEINQISKKGAATKNLSSDFLLADGHCDDDCLFACKH